MGKFDLNPRGQGVARQVAPLGGPLMVPGATQGLASAPLPEAGDFELNLATLWRILWEWRWLILASIGAGLAVAALVTLLTTPLYESTAVVELNPPVVPVMDQAKDGELASSDSTYLETQYGLMRSRALAERVAQELNLASNAKVAPQDADRKTREAIAIGTLVGGFKVTPVPESRLVEMSFLSPDPGLAARIANGFAETFINSGLERRYQASSYARDFLQRQIAKVRRDLEKSERQLVEYAQRQGIIRTGGEKATDDSGSPTGETLIALNAALAEAQTKRIAAEGSYREALKSRPTVEVAQNTAALRSERATLQAEYQEKLDVYQPDHPDMVRTRARLKGLDDAIGSEERNARASRVGTQRAEYEAAIAAEAALRAKVSALQRDVLQLRGRSIQYTILQRDVDTNRALYEALLQRYKEIGVAGGIGTSQASVVDRGEVPAGPAKPNLLFNLLVGLAAGLIVGIVAALGIEFINDTIKTPDDVRDRLKLSFLGGIPASKSKAPIEDLREPTSPLSEAYLSTATSLRFTTADGVPKSLLLTSTRPAEGKSTTTWALAQNFARLGLQVLLIDADMRKPAFVTGHEKEDGLSTMLTQRTPLAQHLVQTDQERLFLLPSGPLPPNPAELLSSQRLHEVIAEASERFDLVLVDGPPILGLADAPLLSVACEATLMVIEAGRTRTRAAVEALNRLRAAGSNVVGVILTRYRHDATGYGYRYDAYSYRSIEQPRRVIRAITSDAG